MTTAVPERPTATPTPTAPPTDTATPEGPARVIDVSFPPWGLWLPSMRRKNLRYVALYGGRGGGKSHTMARALVLCAAQEPLRILCLRETMTSLADSSRNTIAASIDAMGLEDEFDIQQRLIRCVNGSEFVFRGLSESHGTAGRIKSFEGADVAWIEEAQEVSERSWQLLVPTIRKPGSMICVTFNPRLPTDIVYRRFVSDPEHPARSVVLKVNWYDNPWLPDDLIEEMENDRKWRPEDYMHIWEGHLAPDVGVRRVLPRRALERCVAAFAKYQKHGEGLRPDLGLDVADTGSDLNALAVRRGPVLEDVQVWRGSDSLGDTTRRADRAMGLLGGVNLFYDATGIGSGVRSFLHEMGRRPYRIRATHLGDPPAGADVKYDGQYDNRAMFAMRNAQLGMGLQLRALNTSRLLAGEDVDPAKCLFINPDILERPDTAGLLEQLNQPTWDDGEGNKVRVKKASDGEASPDMYDATILAFGRDSLGGLRHDLRV